jgi:hypothetical protein
MRKAIVDAIYSKRGVVRLVSKKSEEVEQFEIPLHWLPPEAKVGKVVLLPEEINQALNKYNKVLNERKKVEPSITFGALGLSCSECAEGNIQIVVDEEASQAGWKRTSQLAERLRKAAKSAH